MTEVKKIKVLDKICTFQTRWTEEDFLFVLKEWLFASFVMKLCVLNEYNIKRHFKTEHASPTEWHTGQVKTGPSNSASKLPHSTA
jgi:hypothetical protein